MKQAQVLFTLQKVLKAHRLTYKKVAAHIGTTESALKNAFHTDTLSLDRLLEILEVIPMEPKQFFALVNEGENLRFSFSEEQELFFTENQGHFRFFQEIFFNRKGVDEIKTEYNLSEISMHRYIQAIEQEGVWSYKGNGAFRFHVSGPLNWRPKGPWMRKYYQQMTTAQAGAILSGESTHPDFVSFGVMSLPPAIRRQFELDVEKIIETYREKAYNTHLLETPNREMFGWNFLSTSKAIPMWDETIQDI
jgi:hypothetical protein